MFSTLPEKRFKRLKMQKLYLGLLNKFSVSDFDLSRGYLRNLSLSTPQWCTTP